MSGILVNGGEDRMLGLLVNKSGYSLATLTLRLFKNDITPAEDDVAGDYTEATFTGYAEVSLASGDWTLTPGSPSSASAAQQTFTSTANQSAQDIYGYYLTEDGSDTLVAAERFGDALSMANNGDLIKVTAVITQD